MHRHRERAVFSPRGRGGFGGGRGEFGGRFGADRSEMRRGKVLTSDELQLVALQLLSEKPHHGYEIIKAVETLSSGIYSPSPGMIYPTLTYLEETEFAVSRAEGNKKLYEITDAGKAFLEKNRQQLTAVLDDLKRYGQRMAYFQDQMAQDEATDERWGSTPRDQDRQEWRALKMEFHDLRHELKAAIFEKLNASFEEKKRVLDVLRKAIAEIRGK